jgi:hypothetical protein
LASYQPVSYGIAMEEVTGDSSYNNNVQGVVYGAGISGLTMSTAGTGAIYNNRFNLNVDSAQGAQGIYIGYTIQNNYFDVTVSNCQQTGIQLNGAYNTIRAQLVQNSQASAMAYYGLNMTGARWNDIDITCIDTQVTQTQANYALDTNSTNNVLNMKTLNGASIFAKL